MTYDDLTDGNNYKETLFAAKSFLGICVKNVLKMHQDLTAKDNLRMFAERKLYSVYIDKVQLKVLIYKINEYKLKKYAEDNYYKNAEGIDREKRKIWDEAKKDCTNFLNLTISSCVKNYDSYKNSIKNNVIVIQKFYRGYLFRLINKMEIMNYKLMLENEKAVKKVREKRKSMVIIEKNNKKN